MFSIFIVWQENTKAQSHKESTHSNEQLPRCFFVTLCLCVFSDTRQYLQKTSPYESNSISPPIADACCIHSRSFPSSGGGMSLLLKRGPRHSARRWRISSSLSARSVSRRKSLTIVSVRARASISSS